MKKIFAFVAVALVLCAANAQSVSIADASMVAFRFFNANGKSLARCAKVYRHADDTLLYIFNAENSFLVVSADRRVPPVLAFSDYQIYNDDDIAAPAKMWLDHYANQIAELKQMPASEADAHPDWTRMDRREPMFRNDNAVLPLMQSHWGQNDFYNYYCPRDFAGSNGRVVTGCVATAMAQLIYYYRFPEQGIGSYSYTDENYGLQSADYGATTFDYDAMCDEPTSINTAISTLMHHCGVGVDMVYGIDGSGMYNHSAARVLRTFFKFSPQTEYLFRDSTDLDWDSVIVSHLSRQIPLYYAGWSTPNINGHGFICDGYRMVDSNYYYHFNFGWDGSSDGYFYTNALNLAGTHFNLAQELIVNAYPDTLNYTYPVAQPITGTKFLTASQGSFTDGSLPHTNYAGNMDFTWYIRPQVTNLTGITLDVDFDVAAGDTLLILPPNSANMAGLVITADSGHVQLDWLVDSATVRFITDQENAGWGFRLNYTTTRPEFCTNSNAMTSPTGTFTDGSDDLHYNDLTGCKYRIVLPNAYSAITLHIREFDLEDGHDFLHVFSNTATDAHLIASFTGSMPDTMIVFNQKRLAFIFETDEQNTAQGFLIDYYGGCVGVDDMDVSTAHIFPNPTSDVLNVNENQRIDELTIYDLTGRVLIALNPISNSCQIPVNQLTTGAYMVKIVCGNKSYVAKFMKK